MPKQVQLRRGSTSNHAAFTGAQGEVTYDTDKKVLVTHDGVTAGGVPHVKQSDLDSIAVITRKSSGAISQKYLLLAFGADQDHVNLCGAGDSPMGVALNTTTAAEQDVRVALVGSSNAEIRKMIAGAVISYGALLEPAAGGKVATLSIGPGTHHVVGRALKSAVADAEIEVAPSYFLRVI